MLGLPDDVTACLFDLDGVLTQTATVHAAGVRSFLASRGIDLPLGRAGQFGCVVGVDRVGQARALRAHGADVVVQDLAELLPDS